jgi:hypothetical protein
MPRVGKQEGMPKYVPCGKPGFTGKDRVFNAVYVVQFLRIWRQWLYDNKLSAKAHFITTNSWEGLEINLVWLLKMIKNSTADKIFEHSSQNCEKTFRKIRSYTGVESTVVNCTMKGFISRIHKIDLCEKIMSDLEDELEFPSSSKKRKTFSNEKTLPSNGLMLIIGNAISEAIRKASLLGMRCDKIELYRFLKPMKEDETVSEDNDDEIHAEGMNQELNVENEDDECVTG